jgi:hypothetical protein
MIAMTDNSHSRDAWNERLSEYIDDELDPAERGALEAHLRTCADCRLDLDALRAVVARASALQDAPPGRDLWSGIAKRIEYRRFGGFARLRGVFAAARTRETASADRSRRFTFTLPQLVAASLALMILSGGMVWIARLGETDFPPIAAESSIVPANFADRAYDQAIDDLERTLDAGRDKLDPQTVRILEQNLLAIDRAIAQCRDALAGDPANVYLNTYLAEARTRKLELLRRAAAIVDGQS